MQNPAGSRLKINTSSRSEWFWPLFLLIPLLTGIPFVVIGVVQINESNNILNTFSKARGTVVDNILIDFGDDDTAYAPVVEFWTRDETRVRLTEDSSGSLPPEFEIGAAVEVLYDAHNPQNARINSWTRMWLAPVIFTGVGALAIVLDLAILWRLGLLDPGLAILRRKVQ